MIICIVRLSIIFLLKIPNFLGSTFYKKFTSTYMMYRVDQLFKIVAFTLKIYLHFLAQRVKSFIMDTNYFLNKIKKIGKLSEGVILWTLLVFTLTYHMGKVLPYFVTFFKLGITNKS